MAELLGELSDDVEELRLPSIEERLARRLARIGKGRRELEITHGELASLIGATRANVSRAMARLEARGVLVRRRGRIELC
jgi:CRP-like cAMP-binding protein